MTPPIRHLAPEWIPEHPALQRFTEFVRERQEESPPAHRILVKTGRPQDGFLDLEYVSPKTGIYLGRLNAHEQVLQIHHGEVRTGKSILDIARGPVDWGKSPAHFPVAGACRTLHFLGGAEESQVKCQDASPSPRISRNEWLALGAVLGWGEAEAIFYATRRRSLTLGLLETLRKGMSWSPATTSLPRHLLREWPAAGLGLLAMQLSHPLSDALGLHPRDERHERWSLAVGAGFLASGEIRGLLNVGTRKITTRPFSLGAGLMSAALADATVGRFWEEGSWQRNLVRETGFFLPAFWQGMQGDRQLALWSRPKFAAANRWAGRVFLGGFLADLGYLAYNHLAHGHRGAILQNRLYARANQLQDREMPIFSLFKGAASLVAPALAERFLVSDQYVRQAAEEMKGQDLRYITSLEDRLQDIQKPGGRVLPVEAVAEQLAAPDVSARIAGFTEDELVRYVRRQFRGHRLTEADAREVLQRISLFQARRQIAFIAPDLRFPV